MAAARFDQQAADQFVRAVRAGARDELAAEFADISLETARAWLSSPRRKDFQQEVAQARADLGVLAIGTIRQAATKDLNVAKWLVERLAADSELDRLRRLTT